MNRSYDSRQGRFTQVDPIGLEAASLSSPQTLNLYSYCGNDPVNHVDPSGLFFGSLFRWIGKIFKSINKILKWVVIAIALVLVVAAVVYTAGGAMPAVLGNFMGWLIGLAGQVVGAASSFVSSLAGIIGIEIGSGIGGSIAAGLYGVGAIASEYQGQPRRRAKRFPCPPRMEILIARYLRTLADMLAQQSGHRTDTPMENGGWIYQKKDGSTFFRKADAWRRSAGEIDLTNPPNIKGARVIAKAHTHPYTKGRQEAANAEGFNNTRPSQRDVDLANSPYDPSKATGLPSLVAYERNPKGINNGKLKAGQIWVSIDGVGPDHIPDSNCR